MAKETVGIKIIAVNKKASFNYFLSDFTECGIALLGTEIKSLRVNGATIGDSYIVIREGNAEIGRHGAGLPGRLLSEVGKPEASPLTRNRPLIPSVKKIGKRSFRRFPIFSWSRA